MTRMIVAPILLAMATAAFAGDYCFVQPYAYEDVAQVDIVNRQLKLYPAQQKQLDTFGEYVFSKEYQEVLNTILLTPRKEVAPLRKFAFKNNTPAYVAKQQQKTSQKIETQVVTQTLQAMVQQNVVVQDGNVLLDVPPSILERIAPAQVKSLANLK